MIATKNNLLRQKPNKGLGLLIVVLVVSGIWFRVVNVDQKVYWLDETFTSLRTTGYLESNPAIQQLFDGRVVSVNDLLEYQQPAPETSTLDVVNALSIEEPQLTPLYFFLVRLWAEWFGSSVATIRSLSVLFSLLTLPCVYWVCQELFKSSLMAGFATAIVAISPFHIIYAQEARPYSLWTLTILLSSLALLRAIRLNKIQNWAIYALTLVLGLYSFFLFIFVSVSHGIYVFLLKKIHWSKTVIFYLVATCLGILAFIPWALSVAPNLYRVRTSVPIYGQASIMSLVNSWVLNLNRILIDFDQGWCVPVGDSHCSYPLTYSNPLLYLLPFTFLLIAYAIYFLWRHTLRETWLFLIPLMGVTAMALILPDFVLGGSRSSMMRYTIPSILGIQISLAYCLLTQIIQASGKRWKRNLWRTILVAVISLSFLSCVAYSQAQVWWNKGHSYHLASIANVINQASDPLVIYPVPAQYLAPNIGVLARVMPLVYLLDPKVKFQFVVDSNQFPEIASNSREIFAYRPTEKIRQWLEEDLQFRLEPAQEHTIYKKTWLWKLSF